MNYKDPKEIEDKIRQAEEIKDKSEMTNLPNFNFAEGVIAALFWVVGDGDDPFMDFE